jgi:predicted DNA-binding protein (MmcQ/YjbR family)
VTPIPLQFLVDYCLGKEGAYLDLPFGEVPICVKWRNHIFAEIYPKAEDYKITLRCDPEVGEHYRSRYPDSAIPAYHVPLRQRSRKSTILLDRGLGEAELASMIDHSYENLVRAYPSSKE